MRRFALLVVVGLALSGCMRSGTAAPTATPLKGPISAVGTVPPSKAPKVKAGKFPTFAPGMPPARLPTVKPVTFPTAKPFPARAYTATIYGSVTDAKSRSPVSGAVINVGFGAHAARTDAFGRYRISFPAGPAVSVTVSKNGYIGQLAMGKLKAHQSFRKNFKLQRIVAGQPPAPPPPTTFGNP